jgi:hypothetical protein
LADGSRTAIVRIVCTVRLKVQNIQGVALVIPSDGALNYCAPAVPLSTLHVRFDAARAFFSISSWLAMLGRWLAGY